MGLNPDLLASDAHEPSSVSLAPDKSLTDPIFEKDVVEYQLDLLKLTHDGNQGDNEFSHAPIVSSGVLAYQTRSMENKEGTGIGQYGLLAGSSRLLKEAQLKQGPPSNSLEEDPRLHFNISHPSSVFICGSQGSGKSHTLSCLLENCLIPSKAGNLKSPLTGLVFHYDTFISDTVGAPCEAAFLSTHPDVKVRVLCSPTNIRSIRGYYSRFNISVEPLQLDQTNLNTKRMMDLMAVGQVNGDVPLYIHTVNRILRELRIEQQGKGTGFDYQTFKTRVMYSDLKPGQLAPLKQRLETLESFMPKAQVMRSWTLSSQPSKSTGSTWEPVAGRLTIVDLSCPCISPETACGLFNICLSIFLEQDPSIGRVIALDEAHKYMNTSSEARAFTATLLSAVRLQRHLAARIIVSTQEPTVSTALLNLCSVTIVHRFTSPEWLRTLQKHLAAAAASPFNPKSNSENTSPGPEDSTTDEDREARSLFENVVQLAVGEALLFAPSAIVKARSREDGRVEFSPLGSEFLSIKIRERLTSDGGKSVLSL